MNVNQVNFTATPNTKKPLSKGQKAAAIAGGIVSGVAAAAVATAYVVGGKKVPDAKLIAKLGTGFTEMGAFIVKNAKNAGTFVNKKIQTAGKWVGEKVKVASEWVGKKAQDLGNNINKTYTKITSAFGSSADELQSLKDDLKTL